LEMRIRRLWIMKVRGLRKKRTSLSSAGMDK
jgi:hypothetical protein